MKSQDGIRTETEIMVDASRTDSCNGNARIAVIGDYVQLTVCGFDFHCGPPDDGHPAPNAGAVVGLSPSEAVALAEVLHDAARGIDPAYEGKAER